MEIGTKIYSLVDEAIKEFASNRIKLSSLMRECARIARLRNDYYNLWWILQEMVSTNDKEGKLRYLAEVGSRFSKEDYKKIRKMHNDAFVDERRINILFPGENKLENKIAIGGVEEIEIDIMKHEQIVKSEYPPDGLHTLDLYYANKEASAVRDFARSIAAEYRKVLARIKQRVHDFLCNTEREILFGRIESSFIEKNRIFVDEKLKSMPPEVLQSFLLAYKRAEEGNMEARSHALLSCRRILKFVADDVYPATDKVVIGRNGVKRTMSEDKYISRLWQYIDDQIGSKSAGKLVLANVQDVGNRIEKLYRLASKGVHYSISEYEMNLCLTHAYLMLGDVLRLREKDSGALVENGDEDNCKE